MEHLKTLQDSLGRYVKFSRYGMECLSQFIFSLFVCNDVNLAKIARGFCSEALPESSSKRIRRFIISMKWSVSWLWLLASNLFPLPEKMWLTLDRTNWKFGKKHLNFLVIGVAYKGIAIPLIWTVLGKAGNSHFQERISLLGKLFTFLPKDRIAGLLADREFVGKEWLNYLIQNEIPFVIRTRENITASNSRGILLPLKVMLRGIKPGKAVIFPKKRRTMGCEVYVVATRKEDGECVILLTDKAPEKALEHYRFRWEIETLFSCLKTRGFNFENTHVTHSDRLSNLMFVVSIAFIMAYHQGEIQVKEKPLKIKKHGYPAKNIFKVGLTEIGHRIALMAKSVQPLCQMVHEIFQALKPELLKEESLGGVR